MRQPTLDSAPGLDLAVEPEPLGAHHRKFFDEQLGPQLSTQAFERFDHRLYTPRSRSSRVAGPHPR